MEPLDKDYRLYGERVYLRPITVEDTDMVLGWRNDDFVVSNFFYRKSISREEHLNWIENKVNKGLVYQFIVCMKDTDEPIGCVYLQHYDESDNSMESGVFMSRTMPAGLGLGTESVKLMNEEFAGKVLKLSRTMARVLDSNTASIKLHLKAGFFEKSRETVEIVPSGVSEPAVTFELVF